MNDNEVQEYSDDIKTEIRAYLDALTPSQLIDCFLDMDADVFESLSDEMAYSLLDGVDQVYLVLAASELEKFKGDKSRAALIILNQIYSGCELGAITRIVNAIIETEFEMSTDLQRILARPLKYIRPLQEGRFVNRDGIIEDFLHASNQMRYNFWLSPRNKAHFLVSELIEESKQLPTDASEVVTVSLRGYETCVAQDLFCAYLSSGVTIDPSTIRAAADHPYHLIRTLSSNRVVLQSVEAHPFGSLQLLAAKPM